MRTIFAHEFEDPEGVIVQSGKRLAEHVIELLNETRESVAIDLKGASAISSSYFNIFLTLVVERFGVEALRRVEFIFVSPIQQQVFERSREALANDMAKSS